MKTRLQSAQRCLPNSTLLVLAWMSVWLWSPGSWAAAVALRLEWTNDGAVLVVDAIHDSGVLSVFGTAELPSLGSSPALFFQTNTPLKGNLRFQISPAQGYASRGFFRAAHWMGLAPRMVEIPAGTFLMGTPPSEAERSSWEGPQTQVSITYPFKMGQFEVTQAEYLAVMGNNPSYFSGVSNRPVEQVSWTNAMTYCARLTELQARAGCLPVGWVYRLPTEAEWEYACRAGSSDAFAYGPHLLSGMGNFDGHQEYNATNGTLFNAAGGKVDKPVVVGSYAPNRWGLFDMHGNVWEWCLDWWASNLAGGSRTNPTGPISGLGRTVRGGCYYSFGKVCRSGSRFSGQVDYRGNDVGFRIVLAPIHP